MAKSKKQRAIREIDRRGKWLQATAGQKELRVSNKQLVEERNYFADKLDEREEQVPLHIRFVTHSRSSLLGFVEDSETHLLCH